MILFVRMGCTFAVGLYATRLVLRSVGPSDYGLLAVLGGTGALFVVAGDALSESAERHLAYYIGLGDHRSLERIFNTTLALFVFLAISIIVIGSAAAWTILDTLTIPPERHEAAWLVFHAVLISLAVVVVISPFDAVVESHQAMGQVAAFEIARSVMHLAIALFVSTTQGDRLVRYALLVSAATILRSIMFALTCALRFRESRPQLSAFRAREVPKIISFAGWAGLLTIGGSICMYGSIVMIGVFFSPLVAAAYAIAMRVGEYHGNISLVFPCVVQPAITSMAAQGKRASVKRLTLLTGRFSTLGVSFFVVPFMLDTEGILALWLGDVPPQAALLVRLQLLWMTLEVLSHGFEEAAISHGQIARYSLYSTGLWIAALPIAAILFVAFNSGAWVLPITLTVITVAMIRLRVHEVGALVGIDFKRWFDETLKPVVQVLAPSSLAAWLVHSGLNDGTLRYMAVAATYAAVSLPLIWVAAFEPDIRRSLQTMACTAPFRWTNRLKAID
jgi:O-antigen/teichoic acid export membrane protein